MLNVKLGHLELNSPLMTASGTSGHGNEISVLNNYHKIISSLGAFVTKGVTMELREGNPEIRIVETHSGILNAIGLQNKGAENFIKNELPNLKGFGTPVIVNISASTIEEFGVLANFLSTHDHEQIIDGIEINVSCPNIKEGGIAFGTDPKTVEAIVGIVKKNVDPRILIITKLTPNVTDITQPARGAINGGTDGLSMINTLRGISINIKTGKPYLGNTVGGLSGPAIKPVGIFMVHTCFSKIAECRNGQIPIIGIGGISTWRDVLEYIMAGATAVGIGTAWFVNPTIFETIHESLKTYLHKYQKSISEIIGMAH